MRSMQYHCSAAAVASSARRPRRAACSPNRPRFGLGGNQLPFWPLTLTLTLTLIQLEDLNVLEHVGQDRATEDLDVAEAISISEAEVSSVTYASSTYRSKSMRVPSASTFQK